MKIKVNYKRSAQGITVQTINDGYIDFCSHAGATVETVGYGIADSERLLCCDKCPSQLINGEWM